MLHLSVHSYIPILVGIQYVIHIPSQYGIVFGMKPRTIHIEKAFFT